MFYCKNSYKRERVTKVFHVFFLIFAIVFAAACQPEKTADSSADLVIVKAPADGIISKILVGEGAEVGENAGIAEIEVTDETSAAPPPENLNEQETAVQNAQKEIENAQKEVEQASVEMQRVEPLAASDSIPQAQLDAARADFQRAREKLQAAREREKNRETQMLVNRSRETAAADKTIRRTKIVVARVPVGGKLKVLNARIGQKVRMGQPLATVLPN